MIEVSLYESDVEYLKSLAHAGVPTYVIGRG